MYCSALYFFAIITACTKNCWTLYLYRFGKCKPKDKRIKVCSMHVLHLSVFYMSTYGVFNYVLFYRKFVHKSTQPCTTTQCWRIARDWGRTSQHVFRSPGVCRSRIHRSSSCTMHGSFILICTSGFIRPTQSRLLLKTFCGLLLRKDTTDLASTKAL